MAEGFNWFLIVIAAAVVLLVVASVAAAIVHHQHPEDRNQAWLPKAVVLVGVSLAVISVLMFPLDVANRGSCREGVPLSSCDLTLPMRDLWFAVYIMDVLLVFFVIPFTVFYYEAGSDLEFGEKIQNSLVWVGMTGVVLGLVLGIAYGLAGYVEFPTERVESGAVLLETFIAAVDAGGSAACIASGDSNTFAEDIRKDERTNGRSRRFRKNFKALNKELIVLEKDEEDLERKFPQGEDADTKWVVYQMSFFLRLLLGVVGAAVSIAWVLHIVLYMLVRPPATPFLNDLFVELDSAFPLIGVAAFSLFCFYMIAVTVSGHVKLGLDFGAFDLYPIRAGATMMNSMLVNTALILLSSTAVIQFCSQAFAVYAGETAIQEIFGSEIENLQGIKYLYRRDVFLYCFLTMAGIGGLLLLIKGPEEWQRRSRDQAYIV